MNKQEKAWYDSALIQIETACMVPMALQFIRELVRSPVTLALLRISKIDDRFELIIRSVILLMSNKTYKNKLKQLIK